MVAASTCKPCNKRSKEGCRAMDNNSSSIFSAQSLPSLLTDLLDHRTSVLIRHPRPRQGSGKCCAHFLELLRGFLEIILGCGGKKCERSAAFTPISAKFWARLLRVHSAGNLHQQAETIADSAEPSSTAMVATVLVPLCPSESLTSVVAVHCLVASWPCKRPSSTPPGSLFGNRQPSRAWPT